MATLQNGAGTIHINRRTRFECGMHKDQHTHSIHVVEKLSVQRTRNRVPQHVERTPMHAAARHHWPFANVAREALFGPVYQKYPQARACSRGRLSIHMLWNVGQRKGADINVAVAAAVTMVDTCHVGVRLRPAH
jgi:hypothetical protein